MNAIFQKLGFVLGRESELSKAEIFSFLFNNDIGHSVLLNTQNILIIGSEKTVIDINELGGTIKLFKILGDNIEKNELKNFIQKNIEINQSEKRINFGISAYGQIQSSLVYAIGKNIKDRLVEDGFRSRFVTGKYKDLSSVIVTENKLLERGFELIVIENKGKYTVGQTLAVQDYKSYSKRDYGRNARDDKSGMLPPKLAQIMINLAKKDKASTIFDPFCGSGTVLQEAILMGYQNLIGSDISEKAVLDTKENLEWLASRHSEVISESQVKILKQVQDDIFTSDILNPTRQIQADAIVGEGYLGEPIRRNVERAKKDAGNLADFYLKTLTNLNHMLKANGRIVLAVPYFIIGKEKVFLPIINKIPLTGLKQVNIEKVNLTPRLTLLYARPDAFVGRELFVLEKD